MSESLLIKVDRLGVLLLCVSIGWETPVARSCEETASFRSGRFGFRLSIYFSDPVKILEKTRSIFRNIALKIFTV